jgi:hypothetical protein
VATQSLSSWETGLSIGGIGSSVSRFSQLSLSRGIHLTVFSEALLAALLAAVGQLSSSSWYTPSILGSGGVSNFLVGAVSLGIAVL